MDGNYMHAGSPMHGPNHQEMFLAQLEIALDAEHARKNPPVAATVKGKGPKGVSGTAATDEAPDFRMRRGFGWGGSVVAVIRGLLTTGIPWDVILTKLLPIIATDLPTKGILGTIADLAQRWLAGEFGGQPAQAAGK